MPDVDPTQQATPVSSIPFGATPPVTPPTFGGGQQPNPQMDFAKRLIQMLAQGATRKQASGSPVPSPTGEKQSTNPPAYMQGKAWGPQRFLYQTTQSVRNAAVEHKQKQLAAATADWDTLSNYQNELYAAQQSGDPKAIQAAQFKVNTILTDPKKLKNMAKALNQDWLNPEKTSVYGEALKQSLANQQKKQQAATGLQKVFQTLKGKLTQPQPQLNDQQRQQMAQEIQKKAPTTQASTLDKTQTELLLEQMKEGEAEKKLQSQADLQAQKEEYDSYKLEQTQKFNQWQDNFKAQQQTALQGMRDAAAEQRQDARDRTMLAAMGIRMSASDKKTQDTETDKTITSTLQDMRKMQGEASQRFNNITKQAQTRSDSMWKRMTTDAPDVTSAKSQLDNLNDAISYIEKNRGAVKSGKMTMDQLLDGAQQKMQGTIDFQPDK